MHWYPIKTALILFLPAFSSISRGQEITMKDIPLSWKDFQVKNGLHANSFDAKTYLFPIPDWKFKEEQNTLEINVIVKIKVDIKKNWVKKEFIKTSTEEQQQKLLHHEKGHWIVAMICFKKLEQALDRYHPSKSYRKDLDSIFRDNYRQCDQLQEEYDKETQHMNDAAAQALWEERLLRADHCFAAFYPVIRRSTSI